MKTHTDVSMTMPARASMLGGYKENMIQYFTGMNGPLNRDEFDILESGTDIHESVQDHLAAEGLLVSAEALIVDLKNDITGHVDAVVRDGTGGGGKRALEIKSISSRGFEKLDGPKDQHIGQVNFYMRQLGLRKGAVLYVDRENPARVKTYEVNYSQSRWERDLKKLKEARAVARTMMEEGVSDTKGFSYSWVDRLRILADVGPTSKQYKEAELIVQKQIKAGLLNEKELIKYENAKRMKSNRTRSYELYPNRFKGKVFNPDTEANIQSINEDIKSAAEYTLPERAVGWLWENFTSTNTFLVNKLWAAKDPLEHYKMTRLYGKEYKPWDEPIRSWIEPYSRGLASKTDPFGGSLSYGTGGWLMGGPVGGVIGAGFGAAYGTVHGLYRFATGSTYMPDNVQEKRDIVSYFDAAKYAKTGMLSQLTTGLTQQKFIDAKNSTLTSMNEKGGTIANLFRATPYTEKPYIASFLNATSENDRKEILRYIPEDLGKALEQQWRKLDQRNQRETYLMNSSQELAKNEKRLFNKSILDPSVQLEDIQLKTVEEQGFDAHEFGLGWNEQVLRMQNQQRDIEAATMEQIEGSDTESEPNISSAHVRGAINELFLSQGINSSSQVYIHNGTFEDSNTINVTIRRDRSRSIIESLNNREKWRF